MGCVTARRVLLAWALPSGAPSLSARASRCAVARAPASRPATLRRCRQAATMAASGVPKIDAYALGTPNGKNLTIALEELGLPYTFHKVTFDHVKDDWFTAISPNGKIPALAINAPAEGAAGRPELTLMESGAIMTYLGKLGDGKLMGGGDLAAEAKIQQWLYWVNAGVGPMFGQAGHFRGLDDGHPAKEYGMKRYKEEAARLMSVLDKQLATAGPYMAGAELSMADLAGWPWISAGVKMGMVDGSAFPAITKWVDLIGEREGVKKGLAVFA